MINPDNFHADFEAALTFVTRLHARQTRKGNDIPYISHLIGVAGIALENGANRDEAIAALLHDSIEDQADDYPGGISQLRTDIRDRFGDKVLAIVEGCTDTDVIPKPPWRERKERYIEHLDHASPSIQLVSCSDKLHNARAILADFRVVGDALWDRFRGGKEGTLWYYRALAEKFNRNGPAHLANELEHTVTELERLTAKNQMLNT